MDVNEHATVQALLQALRVPNDLPRIILVNGRHASEDSFLRAGDVVAVFPPLIGGCSVH
jgi:molybdopterin converting factor small subunit